MIFLIVIAILIVVFVILGLTNSNKPIKSTTTQRGISENIYQSEYAYYKQLHRVKTIEQIDVYIEEKRSEDDSYWPYHKIEYKCLRELERDKWQQKTIKELTIENIQNFDLSTCSYWYSQFSSNSYITEELKNELKSRRYKLLTDLLKPQIKQLTPARAKRWLNARTKEYGYIPEDIVMEVEKIINSETPDDLLRKRNNLRSRISKEKKKNDIKKLMELQAALSKIEVDINKHYNG